MGKIGIHNYCAADYVEPCCRAVEQDFGGLVHRTGSYGKQAGVMLLAPEIPPLLPEGLFYLFGGLLKNTQVRSGAKMQRRWYCPYYWKVVRT